MFGDDPFSEVPLSDEEKKVAFNYKSKWARFWIVFGGPLANLLLAYFLYVGLLAGGEKVPETKIGVVSETSILHQRGLKTGDILVGINDEKVLSFDDLNIKGSVVEKITVKRDGQVVDIPVDMKLEAFINHFVEIVSLMKKPIFINRKGEKFVVSLKQKPEELNTPVEEMIANFKGKAYFYRMLDGADSGKIDPGSESEIVSTEGLPLDELLKRIDLFPIDLSVKNVVMASPADKAKIKKDDILVSLNGTRLKNFEDLREGLQSLKKGESADIEVMSKGEIVKRSITPEEKEIDKKKVKIIGVESAVDYIQPKLITAKADSFGEAIVTALGRTWDGIVKTFSGYKKLITREVSLNNIGGPLAIGKVATDSFNISLSMFFRLMAIISINLGVINLFPIPVLDGGHIMFLFFELINGGPLSRRKLELAQRVGISVLFLLIFVALFNDISRLF